MSLSAEESPEFEICCWVVADLSEEQHETVRRVVNQANERRKFMFPFDRLRPTTLLEQHGNAKVLVCRAQDQFVGSVTFEPKKDAMWISLLAVIPEFVGRGLGMRLVDEVEEIAREQGLEWLRIVVIDMGTLIRYYEQMGFVEYDRVAYPEGQWNSLAPFELASMQRRINSKP